MRLFVAAAFEDDVVDSLVLLQEELKKGGVSGRFTARENLHMTLAFIGEYGDPDGVMDVIEEVPFAPVTVRPKGLMLLRDMYILRFEDTPGLEAYVRRLRRAFAGADIPFDRKRFAPHITIARRVSFERERELRVPEYKGGPVTVDSVSLFRSDRGRNGMVYTELGYFSGKTN